MQVQVISKSAWNNHLVENPLAGVELNENSVVLIDIDPEHIKSIEYIGNKVVITLKNGQVLEIVNFVPEESSLVFRTNEEALFYYDLTQVEYVPLDKIEPLLYAESEYSGFPYLWPILSGVGIAALGGAGGSAGDRTAPQLENAQVTENGQVALDFNEDLDAANPPSTDDFTLTVDGKDVEIADVIVDGDQVTLVPMNPILPGQEVEVSYQDPSDQDDDKALQDAAGNDVADFTTGIIDNNSTVDAVAPQLENAQVTENGQVALEFTEDLDAANPPSTDDFTLTVDGKDVEIAEVIVDGDQVTLVPVNPILPGQEVEVSYQDPSDQDDDKALQDAAGNDVADFTTGPVQNNSTVDAVAPQLENAQVTENGQVALDFNEDLDAANPPSTDDFTLTVDGKDVEIA
ncbi:SwmB domain-containing protein, partial [Acinetobacter sp. B51(2017)]|uniref:SwmB domain-containing protein n=1 Tax=Acinetobacter sp. B51(2017) TaxID=2060938 RepID=UPI000F07E7B5